MQFNIQTDTAWRSTQMAIPGDTLALYGCLVTALANIMQELLCVDRAFTPKNLCDIITATKCWQFNVDAKINTASMINFDHLKAVYAKSLEITTGLTINQMLTDDIRYYIARIPYNAINPVSSLTSDHFVNVLAKRNNTFEVFDTYGGGVYVLKSSIIRDVLEVKYKACI